MTDETLNPIDQAMLNANQMADEETGRALPSLEDVKANAFETVVHSSRWPLKQFLMTTFGGHPVQVLEVGFHEHCQLYTVRFAQGHTAMMKEWELSDDFSGLDDAWQAKIAMVNDAVAGQTTFHSMYGFKDVTALQLGEAPLMVIATIFSNEGFTYLVRLPDGSLQRVREDEVYPKSELPGLYYSKVGCGCGDNEACSKCPNSSDDPCKQGDGCENCDCGTAMDVES